MMIDQVIFQRAQELAMNDPRYVRRPEDFRRGMQCSS